MFKTLIELLEKVLIGDFDEVFNMKIGEDEDFKNLLKWPPSSHMLTSAKKWGGGSFSDHISMDDNMDDLHRTAEHHGFNTFKAVTLTEGYPWSPTREASRKRSLERFFSV